MTKFRELDVDSAEFVERVALILATLCAAFQELAEETGCEELSKKFEREMMLALGEVSKFEY